MTFIDRPLQTDPIGARRARRGFFIGFIVIFLGVGACLGTMVITIDSVCVRDANEWIPYYPDAELVSEYYTGVRAWGMGVTDVILHTPDDPKTVRQWYNDMRQGIGPAAPLADMNFSIRYDEDDTGSNIYLTSECASK